MVIDIKEGVIELEGPIDFVRHYLEVYQPAIKKIGQVATANQARKHLKRISKNRLSPDSSAVLTKASNGPMHMGY